MKKNLEFSNGRKIGEGLPCFVVAEIGNNHLGKFELAVKLIEEAYKVGVDAVKFQKRDIDSLLTKDFYNQPYTGENSFGNTYGEHREKLELSIEEFAKLKKIAEQKGILFFASAWDEKSLYDLDKIGIEVIKVSSADLVNIPLLRNIGRLKKIIFLSTGMSTLDEIDVAIAEIKKYTDKMVILHCNSSYPCKTEETAIPVISLLKQRYSTLIGYSGHELSIYPSIAAVCFGACVVERHFTIDKNLPGTDHSLSLTPREMKDLIKGIREVEKSLSIKEKKVFKTEILAAKKLRKSIVAKVNIKKGTVLSQDNITVKSPGTGVSPLHWDKFIGKKIKRDIKQDEFIMLDDIRNL